MGYAILGLSSFFTFDTLKNMDRRGKAVKASNNGRSKSLRVKLQLKVR